MSEFKFDLTPSWSVSMSRRDYMLNNVCLFFTIIFATISLSVIFAIDYDPLSLAGALLTVAGAFYSVYLTIVWTYARLRDAGLASEGWRVFWIVLSVFSGLIGLIMFLYCCVKPTEDQVILINENDYDD